MKLRRDVLAFEGETKRVVRAGGQGHADFVDGCGVIVGNVALGESPDFSGSDRLAGVGLAFVDTRCGVGQYFRRESGVDHDAIGDCAGHP